MAMSITGDGQPSLNGKNFDAQAKILIDLPTELLEHILCFPVLQHVDICNVSCCCKRLHDVCHGRGKVWGNQYKLRCFGILCYFLLRYGFCGFTPNVCFIVNSCLPYLEPQVPIVFLKVG